MGIFGRMKTLLKANVNDLASKAENPERVLNQLILDMEDQLRKAKLEVRDSITDKKQLKKKLDAALEQSQKWEKKAMTAVKAGEDDLARQALARKQEFDEQASDYQANWEATKANVDQLVDSLKRLDSKIKEARNRKATLLAKAARVEASTSMASSANAVSDNSAFDAFERNAEKVDNFENEVAATAELSESLKSEELEGKFGKLEKTHGTDDALAELKAKMGHSDAD